MSRKHVLITGGSRGIGAAAVEQFANAGYYVSFLYNQSEHEAKQIEAAFGDNAKAIQCDVADGSKVKQIFSSLPVVDILINNAGISATGLFHELSSEQLNRLYGTNLFGTLNCCREVIPQMIANKSGVIINVASVWGEVGASYEVDYSVTKAAVIGLTKALSKELAPSGIRVNCVSPGVIDTDMNAAYDYEDICAIRETIPLERFGEPIEVAKALLFLASDDASYITGQVLSVGGGFGF